MKQKILVCVVAAVLSMGFSPSQAQTTVSGEPVGFVSTTIPAAKQNFFISPVLHAAPSVTGLLSGVIAGLTSNTVSVASAGWTANELTSKRGYLYLTSGTQSGLVVRIIGNSATNLTLDTLGLNLATTGIATNDSFRLLVGETLTTLFGDGTNTSTANVVFGGSSTQFNNRLIDTVVFLDTSRTLRTVYYDMSVKQWRRAGSGADMGVVPIPPFSGLVYNRVANQPLTLTQKGTVPTRPAKYIVPGSGTVFLGRFFPQDGTIASFGLNTLSNWKNTSQPGVTATSADKLVVTDSSGTLRQFYFNGTNWVRAGSGSSQNNTVVPASGAVYTIQSGTLSPQILTVPLPYTL